MSDILELSATDLGAAIRRGETSSVEATRASLDAFARHGGRLNAVVALDAERALADASARDAERAAGRLRGPLHGVPMAHKDMFYRAGRPCACGTRHRVDFVPQVTSAALERLDGAGAVDCGRLNMVELALGITGHNPITGHPRNPWSLEHITGGSSSGPVASVAARLTWGSLGSDTGGSIRVPAACTGLIGLKPTFGRISRFGALPLAQTLDHIGPLTRTAADTAAMLDAMAGPDPRDPLSSHHPAGGYLAALEQDMTGLRIGWAEPPFEVEIADEVLVLLAESRRVLESLGARLVPIRLPDLATLNMLRRVVMLAEAAARHHDAMATHAAEHNPQTVARMAPGFAIDAVSYLRASTWRAPALERFMAETMNGLDMLHLPAMPQPVPRIADTDTGGDPRFMRLSNEMGHLVHPFNYLGLPAISVPIGHTANGLPMAMQLVARPFAEALLLRAAHWVDDATGYSKRRPPVA